MVNRDRHDIAVQILKRSMTGVNKTELIRDVNLSFSQSRHYLDNLLEKRLLKVDEKHRFTTTAQGRACLEKCEACPLFKWPKHDSSPLRGKAR